jgi:hypothetical protein
MPYIPNTPESLLCRADSKNPITTCRGLTGNGRPCRRALASSKPSSPSYHRTSSSQRTLTNDMNGVFAVAHDSNDNRDVMTAAFFCWQHRDQAARMLHVKKTDVIEVQGRSSLDTLVERFGVLEVKEDGVMKVMRKVKTTSKVTGGKRMSGQRATYDDRPRHYDDHYNAPALRSEPERRTATPNIWSLLCCFSPSTRFDEENEHPLNYHNEKHHPQTPTYTPRPQMTATPISPNRQPLDYHALTRPPPSATAFPPIRPKATPASPQRTYYSPNYDFSTPSSLIPQHLPPSTQTQLLAELTKPLSVKDEDGYIYVFQLDREAISPTTETQLESKTLMVKIGRTTNVHRRLSSWTKQCGHTLSLLRFYPYISSASTSPPSDSLPASTTTTPRKLPYSHRVERLIHIELAASNVKKDKCEGCGKEHKEWFEIEASREGVRRMDEVVRRWVAWGEWTGKGV